MKTADYHGAKIIRTKRRWGMCLGRYIFVPADAAERLLRHEYGHHLQWRRLRLLYWPVIALPSLLHAAIWQLCGRRWEYYNFYTESWANRLSAEFFGGEG